MNPAQHDDTELAKAMATVAAIVTESREQAALQQQILDFCAVHHDALYRSCLDGHVTASALVVDRSRNATLLIHHAKLDRWLQPGGHVDGIGDLAASALREAEEEVGIEGLEVHEPAIDLDIHSIPERGDEPAHLHLDVRFLVIAPPGAAASINHESLDARWVTGDDPDRLIASTELRRLVDKGLAVATALDDSGRARRRSGDA